MKIKVRILLVLIFSFLFLFSMKNNTYAVVDYKDCYLGIDKVTGKSTYEKITGKNSGQFYNTYDYGTRQIYEEDEVRINIEYMTGFMGKVKKGEISLYKYKGKTLEKASNNEVVNNQFDYSDISCNVKLAFLKDGHYRVVIVLTDNDLVYERQVTNFYFDFDVTTVNAKNGYAVSFKYDNNGDLKTLIARNYFGRNNITDYNFEKGTKKADGTFMYTYTYDGGKKQMVFTGKIDGDTVYYNYAKSEKALETKIQETKENYEKRIAALKTADGDNRATFEFNDVLDDLSYYTPEDDTSGTTKFTTKAGKILSVITNIGILLSVIIPAVLGIKYMIGSVDEKAEYKKDMVPYLVGAFLLFGISTVVKILQAIGNSINEI